jgi:hypothetical protein
LTTPAAATGQPLVQEPAVAAVEIQNEDSFFFWTFSDGNIPEPQLQILEKQFGNWLAARLVDSSGVSGVLRQAGCPPRRTRPWRMES